MQLANVRLVPLGHRSCDAEPIHVPGSIQPHGLLLLFDAASERLAHWAGDFARLLGREPTRGLQASAILGTPLAELIGSRLLIAGEEAFYVGSVEPSGKEPLNVLASRTASFISVELEPGADSTPNAVVLERIRAVSERINAMPSLADAYGSAAAQARAILGYDNVMIYKFLPDGSGTVVAEARAPDVPTYLGHRFPASDIPPQARELYQRNLMRVIPDVNYTPMPLHPSGGAGSIDMSQFTLRSVSPVHLQYLKNMGVGASMSVSLLIEGKLWGLIVGHHKSARQVTTEARLLCRHVGVTLSTFIVNFSHAENASRNAACAATLEATMASLRSTTDPERTLLSSAEQLARLIDCGGFALMAEGELVASAGRVPDDGRLCELVPLLEERMVGRESFSTDRLPELLLGANSDTSGVIAIRIEASRPLLALWLRPEQIQEICWAGEPRVKDLAAESAQALTPRRSFETWRETVRWRSRPWTWHEVNLVEQLQSRVEFTMQRHRLKQLVQELRDANAILSSLATTDALTGLANRRLFGERLTIAWQRAARDQNSVAIIAIDVDCFKKYNDRFGHPAGDECLKRVAVAIAEAHRQIDVAARLGGEEFGLLLSDTDSAGAAKLAERVRLAVERLGLVHPLNDAGVVTISLGVAAGSPALWGEDPARLLSAADQALYEAKASGRNCIRTAPQQAWA